MIMMMLLPFVLRFPFYAWLSKGWREYIPPTLTCLAFLSMGISCVCLLSKERMKEPSSISLRVHTLVLLEVRCVVAVYSMCVSVLARRRRRWKRCSLGFAFWEVLFFHLQWCCCSFLSSSLRESIHLLFFLFPLLSFCPNIILLFFSFSCWEDMFFILPSFYALSLSPVEERLKSQFLCLFFSGKEIKSHVSNSKNNKKERKQHEWKTPEQSTDMICIYLFNCRE